VLVGTSRKRFTGELLARSDAAGRSIGDVDTAFDGTPTGVEDRIDGSLATATWAMLHGASMVRVHDVAETAQAATIVAGGFGDT
jgi:dihydropteroate synthase